MCIIDIKISILIEYWFIISLLTIYNTKYNDRVYRVKIIVQKPLKGDLINTEEAYKQDLVLQNSFAQPYVAGL